MFGGTRSRLGGIVSVVVVLAAVSGVAVADASNEPPLAEAGLDQTAPVNGTVYLDASGSRDPDGTIESYEWRVETPDGGHRDPQCADCVQTELVVHESGTYNVTVTVTDDDGATHSDTMKVEVSAVEPPRVTLSGSTNVLANETVTVTATVTAGADPLSRLDWSVDGTHRTGESLEGAAATRELALSLSPGNHTVTVEVYDELGRSDTATTWLNVTAPGDGSAGQDAGNASGDESGTGNGTACSRYGGSDGETQHSDDTYCNNDRLINEGTTLAIHDADNDGTVQYANVVLDEEFAQNHEGVTIEVDGTVRFEDQQAYEEAMGVEPNTNPNAAVNENNDGGGNDDGLRGTDPFGSDSDNTNDNDNENSNSGGIVGDAVGGYSSGGSDSGGNDDNGGGGGGSGGGGGFSLY